MTRFGDNPFRRVLCRLPGDRASGRGRSDPGHGAHDVALHGMPGDDELSRLTRNRDLAGGTIPVPVLLPRVIRTGLLFREVGR